MSELTVHPVEKLSYDKYLERQTKLAQHLLLSFAVVNIGHNFWLKEYCMSRRGIGRDDMSMAKARADYDPRMEYTAPGGFVLSAGALPATQEETQMIDFVQEMSSAYADMEHRANAFDEYLPPSVRQ